MNKGIRVLMLLPNLRVSNGVASFAMNYYRNLNHQEIQMDFAVYSHWESPYEEEITASGGHVFLLPPIQHLYSH